jgi:hypothetical protein
MRSDWLPRRQDHQLEMARKWVLELPNADGAWTVTGAEIAALNGLINGVVMDQAAALQGGRPEEQRLREAFTALARQMRYLHGRKFFSPPMVDSDYMRLGLNPPDRVRTEHTIVNELVEFEIRLRGIRELVVNFWVKGSEGRAKPAGFEGAVIVWDVLDAPPELPPTSRITRWRAARRTSSSSPRPIAARPSTSPSSGRTSAATPAPGARY